jgi:hypothetical protein
MQTIKDLLDKLSPKGKKIAAIATAVLVIIIMINTCGDNDSNGESTASTVSTTPTTFVEAVSVNDFRTAHEILDNLLADAISKNASGSWSSEEAMEEFWAAAEHIYKAEMMYLIEMKDMDANKRLINSLALMNIIGDKPSHKMSAYGSLTKYDNYQIFVTRFNRICDEILNISILNNNKETAKQILLLYKEDCSPSYKKDGDDDHYYYDFSNSSKNAALKKYDDAVKNGLLN